MSISEIVRDCLGSGRFKSYYEMAKVTGISKSSLQRIANGQRANEEQIKLLVDAGILEDYNNFEPDPYHAAILFVRGADEVETLFTLQQEITSRLKEKFGQYNLAS